MKINTQAHTPGPWEKWPDSDSDSLAVGPVAGGVAVCQIVTTDGQGLTHRGTLETAAANAALIASAPELLAELERCLSYLANLNGCNWITDKGPGGEDMRRAAKALQIRVWNAVNKQTNTHENTN